MSDRFTCLSLEKLLFILKKGLKTDKIFGIPKSLYYYPRENDCFRMYRYGRLLETPIGVAAGPHTQLSQNIISAWLTGARYIELKTVQVLDELKITRPCINMEDEGYNCEWSQELKLDQSFDEYLNAWVAIYILKRKLGIGNSDPSGFLFNMSVGYSLEGILSPNVQKFLDNMTDAGDRIQNKFEIAAEIFPDCSDLVIPSAVSDNITISTMHGCPPDEIEKIGSYFIEERNLNTTIKLNPTLLGSELLRDILNHQLGFDAIVPDIAFEHDLKYDAGIRLIENLMKKANSSGVEFNLKLTNTLEIQNIGSKLPEKEQMLYMSGRPLHVISMNLAAKLQNEFNGDLDISFSAGADCFNLHDILSCGLKPVTVCSDILKPGGYGRLSQYLFLTKNEFSKVNARSISDYVLKKAAKDSHVKNAGLINLNAYAENIKSDKHYQKKNFPWDTIKTDRQLNPFDCVGAPCRVTCPAGQDVPAYMHYTANGQFKEALHAILQTNPFPNIQGMVCDHPCTQKCTRINYDTPLKIREIKRFIAKAFKEDFQLSPKPDTGLTAAVIGGGPSGFSAAYFLKMNGFSVDLFEAKKFGGGMAADAIPRFRLDDESIKNDIERIVDLGVNVKFGACIEEKKFSEIRKTYDYVYIGVGAGKAYPLDIPGDSAAGVFDQLQFLSDVRQGKSIFLGKKIIVIGGGNSAMDAARAAKRVAGDDSSITILYRRTKKEMPADREEINAVIEEGILIQETVSPESIMTQNDKVCGINCHRMKLGDPDASGRPRPEIVEGADFTAHADSIISAIGQKIVIPFIEDDDFIIDPDTYQTGLDKVYAGGDAIRGASTLVNAIADGQKAAKNILIDAAIDSNVYEENPAYQKDLSTLEYNLTRRIYGPDVQEIELSRRNSFDLVIETMTEEAAMAEAGRCLSCDVICNICATVCPNRANLAYRITPFKASVFKAVLKNNTTQIVPNGQLLITQPVQIINIADFCNECGNCTSFCPTAGSPYRDKPRFYLSESVFHAEKSGYYLNGDSIYKYENGYKFVLTKKESSFIYQTDDLTADIEKDSFNIKNIEFKNQADQVHELNCAAELIFLLKNLQPVLMSDETAAGE